MVDPMHEELALYCERCSERVYRSKPAVETLDGEYMHVECAREYFAYECKNCGCQWGEDVNDGLDEDERGCPECNGLLVLIPVEERAKRIKGKRPDPA